MNKTDTESFKLAEIDFWEYLDDYSLRIAIEQTCKQHPNLDRVTLTNYLQALYESLQSD